MEKNRPSPYIWILLIILLGQAVILSFRLANQSMWTDEMYTARIVYLPSIAAVLDRVRTTEARPPTYYLLLWGWARIVGLSEWGMRYISVWAILFATALTFRLTRSLASPKAALWASLLSATAPSLLLYGRMTRAYTLAVPFALLATLSFWWAWRSPRFYPKLIYLLVSSVFIIIDYLTVFIIGTHILYTMGIWLFDFWQHRHTLASFYATHRRKMWEWVSVGAGISLVFLGLGLILRWQTENATGSGLASHQVRILNQLGHLAHQVPGIVGSALFMPYSFSVGESILPWHPLALLGTLAALILCGLGVKHLWNNDQKTAMFVVLLIGIPWAFMSLIIFGFFLGLSEIVIGAARILYLAPFLSIPMGIALAITARRTTIGLLAILLAARSVSLFNQVSNQDFLNPVYGVPVRELATQVARNVKPGDVVIFDTVLPFDAYYRQIDADTPLWTPGPHMIDILESKGVLNNSLVKEQDPLFILGVPLNRLLAFIQERQPARLWLIVFHHEGTERTIETDIADPLVAAESYKPVSRMGYAPQDPIFAWVRARLRPRMPIQYKAEILLYTHTENMLPATFEQQD